MPVKALRPAAVARAVGPASSSLLAVSYVNIFSFLFFTHAIESMV